MYLLDPLSVVVTIMIFTLAIGLFILLSENSVLSQLPLQKVIFIHFESNDRS